MNLLLASVAVSAIGAALSLLTSGHGLVSKTTACISGSIAALFAIGAACLALAGGEGLVVLQAPLVFGSFSLMLNGLSGLMLLIINVLALASWVYGLSYFDEYLEKGIGRIGFFCNIFIASMSLVVTVDNAFWFLVFFELMSLSSYFLVVVDGTEEAKRGGLMYLIVAHVGFLLIAVSYFLMASVSGSLEFESFRASEFAPGLAAAVFVLSFVGFGCKAGMVPLHSWLPQAHPAAPSNVSALMSGGMIKIGIFGMIKVSLDLLGPACCELWWGFAVLLLGSATAVFGVLYALGESDIKRLLAYSSVENIGVAMLGLGTCFVGVAIASPALAVLGLTASLYHCVNHAAFKSLLFLGAGGVVHGSGTRDMQLLGGLHKAMPAVSALFLVGSLAICALPPLNGFASEWLAYQAMIGAAFTGGVPVRLCMAIAVVSLALTGALALACFVKAYGVTFLGAPRSDLARNAKNVPAPMLAAMAALSALCLGLGLGAPWIAPKIAAIASQLSCFAPSDTVAGAFSLSPLVGEGVSAPLLGVALLVSMLFVLALRVAKGSGGVAADRDPWACGYVPKSEMEPDAVSYAAQADTFMHPLYQIRTVILGGAVGFSRILASSSPEAGEAVRAKDPAGRDPFIALASWLGASASKVEGGDFRVYVFYIIVAFVILITLLLLLQVGGVVR